MTSDFLHLAKVKRFAAVAALALVGVAASSALTSTPAQADEYHRHHHWDRGWDHGWRHHDRYWGPRVVVAPPYPYYAAPRPVYVAPPPAYYVPPPPPRVYYAQPSLNVVIPIH